MTNLSTNRDGYPNTMRLWQELGVDYGDIVDEDDGSLRKTPSHVLPEVSNQP